MLTPRFEAIISLLGKNDTVADIGCDHGKLSAFLIKNGLAKRVFASDISEPSLEKAKKLVEKENLKNVFFYVSDGFSEFNEKPDAAVIAGMGGEIIKNIISHPFAKIKLVLQPMKDSDILFKGLYELRFCIEKEVIAREGGRFYEVILASPGEDKPFNYYLPPMDRLKKDEIALKFLEHKISVLKKAAKGAQNTSNNYRFIELSEMIKTIEGVIKNDFGK